MPIKQVKFTLADVGSEIVDQLSKDIYSDRGSIFREITKNAYDAYLHLPEGVLEDEGAQREIIVQRAELPDGRKISITDRGIGQNLSDLKGFVQIGIAHKKQTLDGATGFRGLGSWSIMGAGSRIRVISSKYGVATRVTLTLHVRGIYKKLSPTVSLDDILNDSALITFEEEACDKDDHFTTVEVLCDGKPALVNNYEINRLWELADPANADLKPLLTRYCAVPFVSQGGAYSEIHDIYEKTSYVPTPLRLDGDVIEKSLPNDLVLDTGTLELNGKVVAHWWHASNDKQTGGLSEQELVRHNLGGTSIQLCRLNVPLGRRGIYNTINRPTDNWFVGEVHIVSPDILPNAGGDDLREGTARDGFIARLQQFYEELDKKANQKSLRLSILKSLNTGLKAQQELAATSVGAARQADLTVKIAKAVEIIDKASDRTRPKTATAENWQRATRDAAVKKVLAEARKQLKASGSLAKFSQTKKTTTSKKKAVSSASGSTTAPANGDLQAKLGRAIPKLTEAGFDDAQIEAILKIVQEVLA